MPAAYHPPATLKWDDFGVLERDGPRPPTVSTPELLRDPARSKAALTGKPARPSCATAPSAAGNGWILAYDSRGSLYYRLWGDVLQHRRDDGLRQDWLAPLCSDEGRRDVAFYPDGQLKHSGSGAGSAAPAMPWQVMRNGGYLQFTQGQADEVVIYKVALSGTTVQQHYNAGKGP